MSGCLPAPPGLRLQSYLGSGPAGHVYRAHDELRGRDVAVKLLDPRRCTRAGLVRLAATAARAATSPIARDDQLYEVVPDPARPFVVMDLLPGESLQRVLLRTGPMAWKRARAVAHAIAVALEAAHDVGVVHGAVKSTNIFIHDNLVYPTDFGIRSLSDPLDADVLLADAEHLAPEQLRGEAADERSDIHGLGLVLFELLTGRLPFAGPPREVFKQQLSSRPPAPTSIIPTLPPAADSLLLQMLDKDPRRRPASASRLRGMLSLPERAPDGPPSMAERTAWQAPAALASPVHRAPDIGAAPSRPARAYPARALVAAALASALAGGLAITCL